MKASSVKFNRNESAELHRTIDELRIEIRRREADFSERIEVLHADLRTRTEQMENLRANLAMAQDQCEVNRMTAVHAKEELNTMRRLLDETAAIQESNARAFIAKCEEVGKWRERATMLATVVNGNVRESRMSIACLILDAKD